MSEKEDIKIFTKIVVACGVYVDRKSQRGGVLLLGYRKFYKNNLHKN